MGVCASNSKDSSPGPSDNQPQPKPASKADAKTDNIERTLATKAGQEAKMIKLLLLGPGESGKSTLFKQIQTLYGEGFTQTQLREAVPAVYNNAMLCLKALADNCIEYGNVQECNEEVVHHLQTLKQSEVESAMIEDKWVEKYVTLWQDPVIQITWANRSDYQIYGCAAYLLNKLRDIVRPEYVPTLDDLLQIRVRTTGIVESVFTVEEIQMKLVDVGGQRNERRKWIHCFENVTAVLFVAAISEYDQWLFEDADVNRLEEAIILFEEVCNSPYFNNTPILIFLNKRDLFEEKITRVPLARFHPDYNGPENDPTAASDWIAEQFRRGNTSGRNKIVYCIVTSAVENDIIRELFVTVKDVVIRETLVKTGLV